MDNDRLYLFMFVLFNNITKVFNTLLVLLNVEQANMLSISCVHLNFIRRLLIKTSFKFPL